MAKKKIQISTLDEFKSSNIKQFRYNHSTKTLIVTFHKGGDYSYAKVPFSLVEAAAGAESVAKAFNETIRDKFKAHKVEK